MGELRPREICIPAFVKGSHSWLPLPKHLCLDTLGNLPLYVKLTAHAFGPNCFFQLRLCHEGHCVDINKPIAYFPFLLPMFCLSWWRKLEETYLSYTGSAATFEENMEDHREAQIEALRQSWALVAEQSPLGYLTCGEEDAFDFKSKQMKIWTYLECRLRTESSLHISVVNKVSSSL